MSIINDILRIIELENAKEELDKLFLQESIKSDGIKQRNYEQTLKQTNEKVLKKTKGNDLTVKKF